jgi:AraC-like DNA-binding protein
MASKGRGPDSMLIHMSPREVQGLQALAMKHGGSLTINPDTGLPEAGFLDKLLPAIIGFAVTAATGLPAWQVGLGVGAVETARTGDLGKGVMAGLGAYGGAGLGAGMSTAGSSALAADANLLAAQQATELSGLESMSGAFGGAGATAGADVVGQAAADQVATGAAEVASPFEKISRGFDAAKYDPSSLLTKDNAKYLMAAAAPVLADQAVKSNLPTTTTKPGMIRPYSYFNGQYVAGNPYEAAPTRAASGGVMGFDESANSPMSHQSLSNMQDAGGMFNYAHDGGGVMKMAEGGIAHFVLGGDVKGQLEQAYAANDVNKINEIARANMVTAADVADTYKGFDTSGIKGLQLYTPPNMENSINSMIADQKAGGDGTGNRTPTYTQYTPEQMGSFLSNPVNKDIDLQKAIKDTNADPNAVNRYIASLTSPFVGSTDTTGGSGTLGIYNNMVAQSIDPTEYYKAALASNPSYGGWNQQMIQKGYNLDKGALDLAKSLEGTTADPKLGYDKQWVKFMDDNKYTVDDMAQAFGLSRNEVQRRYNDAKAIEKKVDKVVTTGTGTNTGGAGTTIPTYTRDGTGAGGSLETMTGLPPGVSGAGITTVNPNGTITTRPNIPGIPDGGFTGMTDVRNAYTTGGGSLGYTPYVPTSIADFNARYNTQTGGSKAAYDYLTGKSPYPLTPSTPTGEVQKPYSESVLGMPVNLSKKMYLFDPATKQYKINPDYAIPTYDAKGNKVYNVTNKDVIAQMAAKPSPADFYAWAKTNNLSVEQIAAATGMPITEVQKLFSGGTPADTSTAAANASSESSSGTGGNAEGGLAALTMARGGTTHQPFFSKSTGKFNLHPPQVYADGGMPDHYNLGGYSDGGRLLRGPGDGVSDSIPATIGNKQPARLADGEFVVPARIVSELGNGSTEAGARKLYAMMDRVQAARKGSIGKGKVANNSRADKYLPV